MNLWKNLLFSKQTEILRSGFHNLMSTLQLHIEIKVMQLNIDLKKVFFFGLIYNFCEQKLKVLYENIDENLPINLFVISRL